MDPLSILNGLNEVVSWPVYVFQTRSQSDRFFCDKVWQTSEGGVRRCRYYLTPSSCYCLGYLKTGDCKHLRMLTGREWVKGDVPRSYAERMFVRTLVALSGDHEVVVYKEMMESLEDLPDIVKEISIGGPTHKSPYKVAWITKFLPIGEIGIMITSKNFPIVV